MKHLICLAFVLFAVPTVTRAELRVGAAITDITPAVFPVLVNGGFQSRTADKVNTPISARSIVIDDGQERIAIVVVDSCMVPRPLADDAKHLAAKRTKIKPDRMLISATHTHSAPSSMGALGTSADERYVAFLRTKLADSIAAAEANLEPALVGWGKTNAAKFTALRRWIRRPDRVEEDPFGNLTVRANMHAARNPEDVTGESGPEDPELTLISFVTPAGRPIAALANFSMHYFGDKAISADYFGLFCNEFQDRVQKLRAEKQTASAPPFVAILSHGCSGDIWRRDYSLNPEQRYEPNIDQYSSELLDLVMKTYNTVDHASAKSIAMVEQRLRLNYRVPDAQRLQWAQRIIAEMGDRLPKTKTEVYAREQIILHELQSTDVVVQALRIGDIGIASTPTETYALTGLKIKLQSPLAKQMVIELANGGDGYIPPPEQHYLGGYNTWAARSAGLEIQAEPKIAEAALQSMEQVAGTPRQQFVQGQGAVTQTVLKANPYAFYRLDELAGPLAADSSANGPDAVYEPGVVFFVEGPQQKGVVPAAETNRAAHFAGGRLHARVSQLGEDYAVSLWFWNGMPNDGREVAGWIFSRDRQYQTSALGDHLGLSGTKGTPGRLMFAHGNGAPILGKTTIERWTWNHLLFVRRGKTVKVYLNGNGSPEIDTTTDTAGIAGLDDLFLGGRCDNNSNWEGRLDEIAVFNRALGNEEVTAISCNGRP